MKNNRIRRTKSAGFSLAELMVVIVIIGLLLAYVAPNVMKKLRSGQEGRVKIDIMQIESALTDFAVQNGGVYPDSLESLVTPDENGLTYLKATTVPLDPWKNEYQYEPPGPGETDPTVYSFGEDGQRGGDGKARDITNHMITNGEI